MFARLNIEIEDAELKRGLDRLEKTMATRTAKRMLAAVLARIKKETRKNLCGPVLHKVTGTLFKSVAYTVKNDFSGKIRASAMYASIQEKGARILPVRGKLLWMKIQGKSISAKSVTLPARPFMGPVVEEFTQSAKMKEIMDPVLQKALDEIFPKEGALS